MNWKFFIGSCILATGLLLKAGAPLAPLALGLAGAACLQWRRTRRAATAAKKP